MICLHKLWYTIKMWGFSNDLEYIITDRMWLPERSYIDCPPKDEPMIDRILRRCQAISNMIKTIYNGNPIPHSTGFYKSGENKSKRWMFCWGRQQIL